MKKLSIVLALFALFFADLALAAGGVVTSLTGTVTAQAGTAAPRALRLGDEVKQGETVVTGALSSVVLKFDDGEIAALTANSKLAVTAYQYNPQSESGNVFLSLLSGGMRAVTGLIGRRSPNNVAYRAATATIGIRGTTVDVATDGIEVAVQVDEGIILFTIGDKTLIVAAGEAIFFKPGALPVFGQKGQVLTQIPPIFADVLAALNKQLGGTGGSGGSGGGNGGNGGSGGSGGGAGGGGTGGSVSNH